MSDADIETIKRGYEAWNRGDFDAALAVMDPEVTWQFHADALFPGTDELYRGHDGVRRFFELFAEPWERIRVEIDRIEEAAGQYVVYTRLTGVGKGSGVEIEAPFVDVLEMRGGRLLRWRGYTGQEQALAALERKAS